MPKKESKQHVFVKLGYGYSSALEMVAENL